MGAGYWAKPRGTASDLSHIGAGEGPRRRSRRLGTDDPSRSRREHAVRTVETGKRLTQVVGDLRPHLVYPVFPQPQHLACGTERHVELDGVIQVPADLERQ